MLFLLPLVVCSQDAYYLVQLKDKACSKHLTEHDCLSPRSIDRRAKHNVKFSEEDLPICKDYLIAIGNMKDVKIHNRVKWFNQLTVHIASSNALSSIQSLPFVSEVSLLYTPSANRSAHNKFEKLDPFLGDYGNAWTQNGMIAITQLHKDGYAGINMEIAVFDAGFRSVDTLPPFQHLWQKGRILGTKDFVNNRDSVFYNSNHGTSVLSTMAMSSSHELIGTAPQASYYLMMTEDAESESLLEEYNWAEAAAYVDSLGVDIINSSLGYTLFEDSTTNHTYEDMDGNTTPVTRAANKAYEKGILVVNSAGNYGDNAWYYMGAPSDGYGVLSIGAVGADQSVAPFSSRGPNSSGQVKPDVCAMGWRAFVLTPIGSTVPSNGTSFSGPIVAGAAACLWQAFPEFTNEEIMQAIRESAHLYDTPDHEYGYGIPDFSRAVQILEQKRFPSTSNNDLYQNFLLYPNPTSNSSQIEFVIGSDSEPVEILLVSIDGRILIDQKSTAHIGLNNYTLDTQSLPSGVYLLKLKIGENSSEKTLIVSRP